jgi:pyruvate,orthophosphate dikinase
MASIEFIGTGVSDPARTSAAEVGAKAFNLMRMDRVGLPVPPAFVLGTAFCRDYFARDGRVPADFPEVLAVSIRRLENATGRTFGGRRRPLLVAVRSGAPVSMPGMMDSILNIGLTAQTVRGLIRLTGNPRLAWDCYRRLTQAWGEIIGGIDAQRFERLVNAKLDPDYCASAQELDAIAMRELAAENLKLLEHASHGKLPQDPIAQLSGAIEAVFRSWNSPRAVEYRRLHGIDSNLATAVTVQTMVFGNAGGRSGSGVGFTRDPAIGANRAYMDFLFNAQGEDVVSGRRSVLGLEDLQRVLPAAHTELNRVVTLLESEFRDLQDFEFTIEEGNLYLLQTRSGKRTPWAALQVAVDMVEQGLIDPEEAMARLAEYDLQSLRRLRVVPDIDAAPVGEAGSASTGVAVGAIALDNASARALADRGEPAILVRDTLSTDDIAGLASARGILTARGGRTSHAAVVARQVGIVCLAGCRDLHVDLERRCCSIGGRTFREGEVISLDGDGGRIFAGSIAVVEERPEAALRAVESWRTHAVPAP